ncbi:MAG TPA: tetratricopeptide repeat protein [Kofleriaceae bacterium]|nr:tetratricopeptide repeat protein [Kofleriaceae bacterium]
MRAAAVSLLRRACAAAASPASVGLAVLVVCAASVAAATPSQDLERGRASFKARDWQSAREALNDLLYPDVRLARSEDIWEAYVLLGASSYESGDRPRAIREFEKAIQLDPETSITTLTFSEGAVRLYDQTREDVKARMERLAAQKKLAEQQAALEAYKKSLIVYETRPFYFNFLPFGLAQLSQQRYRATTLFAIGQGATLATNLGIYGYLVGTYGFESTAVDPADAKFVRRLQQVQIGAGVAFVALYAWGVYDSIRHHQPRRQVKGDDSLIPDDLKQPAKRTSFRDRLRLTPMMNTELGPPTVGLGIGWEN